MKIFAMYDRKANCYPMQPFPESSTASALRGFEVAVNNSDSIFSRFPDDFELHELATFDKETGLIESYDRPQNLGTARTVLKSQPLQQKLFSVDQQKTLANSQFVSQPN